MDFELSDDQASILDGLDKLLDSFGKEPPKHPIFSAYAADVDAALAENGYLDIAREEGFGPLDGALIVEQIARYPRAIEAAATILIAPALGINPGIRPIALSARIDAPARYLPMAGLLLVLDGDAVRMIEVTPDRVEEVETLFAYPYGRLRDPAAAAGTLLGGDAARTLTRKWRLAIAAESAGLMQSALDVVLEHVKTRVAFGRPLGAFQAIQHRLAMAAETVQSTKWLALRAAYTDSEQDCAVAACFAQDRIPQFTYDLHQFSGAMGLTLEYPLHYWSYRLRALLGELGGSSAQARAAAQAAWGKAA
ncbi:acyl-CoA dehydrogenase family protein [Sphingomonas naphthae]|uniref:Acyl-CoA dehydrogenase family protein n=1 Tax=Sphingomonas naphthae TaxID=1813468 RepID=A0ABY7TKJ0_9SPHN|nr:acyl-CoA dehydrogenase family protein [Sphingomonas naphthae]WCT73470.1 acyl-CoA dehydrogenase family protein [Sphingomonas naphthae]